jgi:hypothetical protein
VRKSGLASLAGGGARKDNRAAAEGSQSPRRLAANQKACKAANPPELLKLLRAQLLEIDAPVVAGIEDDHVLSNTSARDAQKTRARRPCSRLNAFASEFHLTGFFQLLSEVLSRSPCGPHVTLPYR